LEDGFRSLGYVVMFCSFWSISCYDKEKKNQFWVYYSFKVWFVKLHVCERADADISHGQW